MKAHEEFLEKQRQQEEELRAETVRTDWCYGPQKLTYVELKKASWHLTRGSEFFPRYKARQRRRRFRFTLVPRAWIMQIPPTRGMFMDGLTTAGYYSPSARKHHAFNYSHGAVFAHRQE